MKVKVGTRSRLVHNTFTRACDPDEVDDLLDTPVSWGGSISVRMALSMRRAVVDEVLFDDLGNVVAVAHIDNPQRSPLISMGMDKFDAMQRLATLAVRP